MNSWSPSLLVAAINHLLAQERWAREKLAAHGGKRACLDVGALAILLKISADGMLEAGTETDSADVTIHFNLADLPLLVQNPERAFAFVRIEGDAELASCIAQLMQTLHWDAESDLAQWVGDIPAVRIVAGARSLAQTAKATRQSLTDNIIDYLTEENPLLIRPPAVAELALEVSRLRDDAERLQKRLQKLEQRCPGN